MIVSCRKGNKVQILNKNPQCLLVIVIHKDTFNSITGLLESIHVEFNLVIWKIIAIVIFEK